MRSASGCPRLSIWTVRPGCGSLGLALPRDLSREDRKRVRNAASVLTTPEVVAATQGIEQHALDICKQSLI